jgi:hypothetical protein
LGARGYIIYRYKKFWRKKMKKNIKETLLGAWGKVKAAASRAWEKMKSFGEKVKIKAKELADIADEKLKETAPEVNIKVKKAVLISLASLIGLGIIYSITVNIYSKDVHVFSNDKCENCGISSSLVYKFEYLPETDSYSVSGRNIWKRRYDDVILPDSYKGKAVSAISPYAFDYSTKLRSVVIPDSVEEIGRGAFLCTGKLDSVTFGNGLKAIGQESFGACPRLEVVVFPESLEYIGIGAFFNCTKISGIAIPDGVKTIDNHAFEGCTNMKSLKIGESVEVIGNMAFAFCNLDTVEGNSATFRTEGACLIENESGVVAVGTNA